MLKKDRPDHAAGEVDHFGGPCPNYQVSGTGPLLVSIPGLDGTGELLFKQLPALTQHFRVVRFRLRESGNFSYADLAGDIAAVINDIGEKHALIVGESFGGTVALWFALLYPAMVDRLAIINSFPRFRNRLKIAAAARLAASLPHSAVWLLRAVGSSIGLVADGVSAEDRRRCYSIFKTVKIEAYRRRLELIQRLDLTSRLCEITVPTLFIAAERDLLVPSVREARYMASLTPNATVNIVPGAGHACLLGGRVQLASLLLDWMATSPRR